MSGDELDRLAPARVREQVRRLHGKLGLRALGARVGLGWRRTQRLLAAMGLAARRQGQAWGDDRPDLAPEGHEGLYTADDYLRDRLGEMGWRRVAEAVGVSMDAAKARASHLGLRMSDLRTDLTASVVARLIGWSEPWVRAHLGGRTIEGVWRIWPSELREWILEDVRRVRWERVAGDEVLETVALIVGDWGVGDDAVKAGRAAPALRPARRRQGA